jgi:rhomboid protease GluP
MQQAVITYGLIAINVLVWIANVVAGFDILNPSTERLIAWGANQRALTINEPWRLLSATFLHGGIIHLLLNMMSLRDVGRLAESFYGRRQFLILYLVSGLCGSLASLFFGAKLGASVGASGAIFGVTGALFAAIYTKGHLLQPQFVKSLRNSLLLFTGLSLYMGFVTPAIDNAAHIGGLVAGIVSGMILPERFDHARFALRSQGRWLLLLGMGLVLTAIVLKYA